MPFLTSCNRMMAQWIRNEKTFQQSRRPEDGGTCCARLGERYVWDDLAALRAIACAKFYKLFPGCRTSIKDMGASRKGRIGACTGIVHRAVLVRRPPCPTPVSCMFFSRYYLVCANSMLVFGGAMNPTSVYVYVSFPLYAQLPSLASVLEFLPLSRRVEGRAGPCHEVEGRTI